MIDSHAHVAFPQFDGDREEVISRAREAGVGGWVEVGTGVASSEKAISLARQYRGQGVGVGATVGVHPSEAEDLEEGDWRRLRGLAREEEVKAVGEVGIDLYRGGNLPKQLKALTGFMALARSHGLPIVFHVRSGDDIDAHDEVIKLLASYSQDQLPPGVMHSFNGSRRQAEEYLELGMYLAFNGVVTFKNAGEAAEATRVVPLDRMLLETDCPFLAPEPYRGQRNEPAYVELVARKVAELRRVPLDRVELATQTNTRQLFGI